LARVNALGSVILAFRPKGLASNPADGLAAEVGPEVRQVLEAAHEGDPYLYPTLSTMYRSGLRVSDRENAPSSTAQEINRFRESRSLTFPESW
jgi:hypothetical protein